jgi:hypothetical protein
MNTVPTMKLISLLARLALAGLAAFVLGVAFDAHALALFAFTTSALVLLVAAGDYAPRTPCWQPRPGAVVDFAATPARSDQHAKRAA